MTAPSCALGCRRCMVRKSTFCGIGLIFVDGLRKFRCHARCRALPLRRPVTGDRTASSGSSENGIFRKEGEYWTVGYGKRAFRLKDTKGFAYLAHLLRHPGTEFHVLDL